MYRPVKPVPVLPPDTPARVLRRDDLLAAGATGRAITRAVREGTLLRPRRGAYLPSGCHPHAVAAARLGGRLDGTTLLARYGVFVFDGSNVHVRVDPHARAIGSDRGGALVHWAMSEAEENALGTTIVEALAHAVITQPPRMSIATLDSAWQLRLVDEVGIAEVFRRLPRRFRRLRPLLDRRAEAGTETLVRLMLRALGTRPELQAEIAGVGFVDLLVDGWLIVECDSAAHHSDWRARLRDLRRDADALALGYTTLRLAAEDILYRPDWVMAVLRAALANHGAPLRGRP